MTRPEQPLPYPGDVETDTGAPPVFRREYRDLLGRLQSGDVTITPAGTVNAATFPLVDGVIQLPLAPGTYRVTATLMDADGRYSYDTQAVTL